MIKWDSLIQIMEKYMRRFVVMGNWKLNGNREMVTNLIKGLSAELNDPLKNVDVVIAPPAIYLDFAKQEIKKSGDKIKLGAQNCDLHTKGAFTGEICPEMLFDVGAQYIIIGHSERRQYHKESDSCVADKFALLLAQGLTPVFCIGETLEENEAGKTQEVCARQIDAVLKTQGAAAFENAIIAYEPVWAIGTGKAATAAQAQAVHKFIRDHIAKADEKIAQKVIIQYGGSVKAENAKELFLMPDIDGALVGGAALDAKGFAAIAKAAATC
jgi:triosephosphate isomerase